MISRFENLERKIASRERSPPLTPTRNDVAVSAKKDLIISVQKLQRISDTFDDHMGIQKIQELLLSVERNVDGELA